MTVELYREICRFLKQTIAGTDWEGHVYAVGGCCRDEIMGNEIKDIDLAVDIPDGGVKFAKWLVRHRLTKGQIVLFRRFGTARVVLRRFRDVEIEIVQTRKGKYTAETDSNPALAFGSLTDDAFRRDLTINTLFYDISREQMLDPTGMALDDIAARRLRTPLDPDVIFDDDPLRVLRCVRFAMRYGHELEPALLDSMRRHVEATDSVSRERMRNEFEKILTGPRAPEALEILDDLGLMRRIVPELDTLAGVIDNDGTDMREHALATFRNLVEAHPDAPAELRWAALLHDLGKPQTRAVQPDGSSLFPNHESVGARLARQALRRLRYERPVMAEVTFMILNHGIAAGRGENGEKMKVKQLRRIQLECGSRSRFDQLMALIDADTRSHRDQLATTSLAEAIIRRTDEMVKHGQAMFNYELPVTQEEIIRFKRCNSAGEYEKVRSRLLKLACSHPGYRRPDFLRELGVENVSAFETPQPEAKPEARKGAKRRRHDHRRRRNASGKK